MKLTERILLGLIALQVTLLLFTDGTSWGWFAFCSLMLGVFYLVGSYWLFKPRGYDQLALVLFSGAALLCSLFALIYLVQVVRSDTVFLFAAPNAVLFLGSGIYLGFAKIKKLNSRLPAAIFTRSAALFLVAATFAFTPVTVKAFRKVLLPFNKHDYYRYNNLLMFEYSASYDEAIEQENCTQAIFFGLKALEAGKRWLSITTPPFAETNTPAVPDSAALRRETAECHKISKTYDNLYYAYKCQAEKLFQEEQYTPALEQYTAGHHYLVACTQERSGWRSAVSWSLINLAVCQRRLNKGDLADSTFISALQFYKPEKDVPGTAERISYYGDALTRERLFHQANLYFAIANKLLLEDTVTLERKASVTANSLTMVLNYIQQDSLPQALRTVKQATTYALPGSIRFCRANLYYGAILLKQHQFQQADSAVKAALSCFQSQPEPVSQNIAECQLLLCHINAAQANYPAARQHLTSGTQITEKNYGAGHVRYAHYIRTQADLEQLTGNYSLALGLYRRALALYIPDPTSVGNKAETLSGLAFTELTLSDFEQANAHADTALAIAFRIRPEASSGMTDLLNIAANIDYFLGDYRTADSLYQKVVSLNKHLGLKNEITTATALNGLGLLETERRNFAKADSLFLASISIYQAVLTESHPLTANAYLNHSTLLIRQNRFSEAEHAVAKAEQIYARFHKPSHDAFGDVLMAKGDLARRRKEPETALAFYQKALVIYTAKFSNQHWKVKHAAEKSASMP